MIPVTYPSSVSTSKESQMVVFALSSVAGLQRWTDYIPVKYQSTGSDIPNSFNTNGYIACDFVTNTIGRQAWVDYVPVFVDNLATTAWQVSDTGFIPFNTLAGGGAYVALYLDFINSTSLDSRITFSRGTNATLTDSNGRVAYAPHNLLTNSEDFEAAAWSRTGSVSIAANSDTAPDGTITADRFVSTGGAFPQMAQAVTLAAGDYTLSMWVRSDGTSQIAQALILDGTAVSFTPTATWTRITVTKTGVLAGSRNVVVATNSGTAPASSFYIWGAQLNIANAPVNLLTWSEQFDNLTAWALQNVTVTANAAVAPDGTTTADRAVVTANSVYTALRSVNVTVTPNTTYTYSYWLNTSTSLPANTMRVFNATGGVDIVSSQACVYSGGWVRQTCTFTTPAGCTAILVYPVSLSVGTSAAGNFFDIWGAQLNTGSVALPYVATTSSIYLPPAYNSTTPKNLLGFTQEPENAAWTKSNSYVQQNLLTWSQDFDNAAWNKGNVTVTANAAIAPDGSATADNLVTVATTAITGPFTVAGVASATNTQSFYVKQNVGIRYVQLLWTSSGTSSDYADFDLQTGTLTAGSYAGASITAAGNGWYRISLTSALSATAGGPWLIAIPTSTAGRGATYVGNGTDALLVWGAQLVQGSTAGDYTQTTSAAAPTRYVNWDGTLTGRKLVEDTAASSIHLLLTTTDTAVINGTRYTSSLYARAAERSWIQLAEGTGTTAGAYFNLASGAVGTVAGTGSPTASIQSVGGGWYRCTLSWNAIGAAARLRAYMATGDGAAVYTGDGTSGIYVSDFQLSNSASVDPYVYNPQAAAASTAYYGPRFDYDPVTLAAKGLLIEEQRTNLLTYSEQFDNAAWTKSNATVTANASVSPDGATTADKLVEDTATSFHYTTFLFTPAASTSYTVSVYAKASERTRLRISGSGLSWASQSIAVFDLSAGTVVTTSGAFTSASITSVGNGWYRCTATGLSNAAPTASQEMVQFVLISSGTTASYTGDGTSGLFIWGAQLEAGSFATSYIPTVASQVTRNADSASMLGDNFYTWYNPNQGTFAVQFDSLYSGTPGSTPVQLGLTTFAGAGGFVSYYNGAVVSSFDGTNRSDATIGVSNWVGPHKIASAYGASTKVIYANGATLGSGAYAGTWASATGFVSTPAGHIRRIGYYNTRLPDSTLQALTT